MSSQELHLKYGYSRTLGVAHSEAVGRARKALQAEGFGVLFEIDMKEKLKEKLGIDFRNYLILGACSPALAYQALQEEIDIGLLLPCNLIVYEQDGGSVIAAVDAAKMMSVVGNPRLESTASQVNVTLRRVIDTL